MAIYGILHISNYFFDNDNRFNIILYTKEQREEQIIVPCT